MNIASEQTHSSLAQRLAKVRNCLLVEVSTGVSPNDKDLFASLCQTYEQSSVVTSCIASTSSQNAAYQAFSISDLKTENSLPHGCVAMSGKDRPSWQRRVGFSLIRRPHMADSDDWTIWTDWDKKS